MDIQANGIRIRVNEKGHGEQAVVFLHYWGGSSRTWQIVTDELSDKVRHTLVSGDIALVLLDWTLTMSLHDGSRSTETGTATQVMERGCDGAWKLRISNPIGVA